MLTAVSNCPSGVVDPSGGWPDVSTGRASCPRIPLLPSDGKGLDIPRSLELSLGWAYVVAGSERMPKGEAAVTVCHQYGDH
jgi:hypothetical protein